MPSIQPKPWPAWIRDAVDRAMPDKIQVDTLRGTVHVDVRDWKSDIAASVAEALRRRKP